MLISAIGGIIVYLATFVALSLTPVAECSPVSTLTIPDHLIRNDTSATLDSRANSISVMVVGDSMTQGKEGDWTWRYRLWEWFNDQGVQVDCSLFKLFVLPAEDFHSSKMLFLSTSFMLISLGALMSKDMITQIC
jgi:hypothetical protein